MSALQEIQVSRVAASEPYDLFTDRGRDVDTNFVEVEPESRVTGLVAGVPISFLEKYADLAMQHVLLEEIARGDWFADVKGLPGAWGNGKSPDEARAELRDSIVGWVAVRLEGGLQVPPIDGLDLNPVRSREQAA